MFGSVNGGPPIRSPIIVMTVPRGLIGVMRAILVIFAAAGLIGIGNCVVTRVLHGEQRTAIGFIRKLTQ
jgi:hypothetical protein